MDSQTALIILLSVTLIVFLVFSIVFLFNLIKISRNVNSLTEKVDDAADNVVSATSAFKSMATPLAISTVVGNLIRKVVKSNKRRSKHRG